MAEGISTARFSSVDRFEAWRQWFWPLLEIAPTRLLKRGDFVATNKVWNLDGLVVSKTTGPPVVTTRTKSHIAKAPVDHWVLSVCTSGMTRIETRNTVLHAAPGTPFLWSLGDVSRSERTQVERIQILLPRDMLQDIASSLDALRGSTFETPLGKILGEYMMALEGWLPKVDPDDRQLFGKAVRSMLVACLAPSVDHMEIARDELNGFQIDRVRRAVKIHLGSPSLGPEALCKMVGMSRSSLYRLFEPSGGIVRYIQRQRLLHAYALLSDPSNRQPIVSISDDICFGDPSSFSRAFRREFGHTPKAVRTAAADGLPPPLAQRDLGQIASFRDFLRSS